MHITWTCEASNTSALQAVSTNKAMCLSSHFRKDGGFKLAREFIDYVCRKICKEIITVEREKDAITAEHLRVKI